MKNNEKIPRVSGSEGLDLGQRGQTEATLGPNWGQ